MILTIHGWQYNTDELSELPSFETRLDGAAGPILRDGGELALAYKEAGFDSPALAQRLGCSVGTARRALGWYGLVPQRPLPSFSPHAGTTRRGKYSALDRPDYLRALYAEHGTQKAVADVIGCSESWLRDHLHKYGIERPKPPPEPEIELPQGNGHLTRKKLRALVARAYLRNDRCPPDCPGREQCLDSECIANKLLEERR